MFTGLHGHDGPLVVTQSLQTDLADAFIKAGLEAGYEEVDLNGDRVHGVARLQATINNGARWSTAKAYLRPAMARPNLHVATLAMVINVSEV